MMGTVAVAVVLITSASATTSVSADYQGFDGSIFQASNMGMASKSVAIWRDHGLLMAHAYNDKNQCL